MALEGVVRRPPPPPIPPERQPIGVAAGAVAIARQKAALASGTITGPFGQPFDNDARRLELTRGIDRPLTIDDLRRRQASGPRTPFDPNRTLVQGANGMFFFQSPDPQSFQEDPGGSGVPRGGMVAGGSPVTVDPVPGDPIDGVGGSDGSAGGGNVAVGKLSGLVDPSVFANIINSLDTDGGETITAVDVAPDGTLIVTITGFDGTPRQITVDAATARGGLGLEQERNDLQRKQQELDEKFRRDELKINEQIARLNAEIATERIRVDAQIANGQLALAIETQNRIDEREKQSRQLERDLFNANMSHQRDVLNLERSRFELERQQFLMELSSQPGSMLDFFNVSRGLPTAGLGGPLPEGISRAVGLNPVQQANQGAVINPSVPLAPLGDVPQVGPEAASPVSTFDISQFQAGAPPVAVAPAAGAPPLAGAEDPGGTGVAPGGFPAAPPLAGVEDPGGTGVAPGGFPAASQAAINEVMSAVGLSQSEGTLDQGPPPQQVTPDVGEVQTGQQRFQLPPELLAVFGGGQASDAGELQLPDTGVPFLSQQQLAGMTPAGRELYEAIIKSTGLRVEDFNFIGQQRAPTSGRQISRRV